MSNRMKKILYIAPHINTASGGAQVSNRNKKLLRQLVGDENFFSFEIQRKSRNLLRMLWEDITERSFYGLNKTDKTKIVELINNNNISCVFLDSSNLGGLIDIIHKHCRSVQIITFFHNVEIDFSKLILKLSNKWYLSYRIWLAKFNESRAIYRSDITICLNKRDADRLYEKYKKKPNVIIPVTLDSNINQTINRTDNEFPNILFLGSNFPPNVEGIKLFINKVMPHIKGQLTIAGSGMEEIKESLPANPNIKIMGFVENLDEIYNNADIVILPIFSGSGMKVKTAEALKYGKYIIATNEALEGYKINDLQGVIRCTTIEDFISAINNYTANKISSSFLIENRKRFLEYYSNESALSKFRNILYKSVINP